MLPKMLKDVEDFQKRVLGLDTPDCPQLLVEHRFQFARKFLHEELHEFEKAQNDGSLPDSVDALIDLIYVALGRLVEMGVPPGPVFDEVHQKNMLKYKGETKRGHKTDAAKPDDWTPPDHTWLLHVTSEDVEDIKDYYKPRPKETDAQMIRADREPLKAVMGKTTVEEVEQQGIQEELLQKKFAETKAELLQALHGSKPPEHRGIPCADKKDPLAKPQIALIPYEALVVEAEVMAYGAYVKYSPWNWLAGRSYTEVLSSISHHLRAWSEHETKDPESGLHHLGHARADIAFLIVWEAMHLKGFDDRRPIETITYHKPTEPA